MLCEIQKDPECKAMGGRRLKRKRSMAKKCCFKCERILESERVDKRGTSRKCMVQIDPHCKEIGGRKLKGKIAQRRRTCYACELILRAAEKRQKQRKAVHKIVEDVEEALEL